MDGVEQISFVRSSCLPGMAFLCASRSTAHYSVVPGNYSVCLCHQANSEV